MYQASGPPIPIGEPVEGEGSEIRFWQGISFIGVLKNLSGVFMERSSLFTNHYSS